MNVKTVGGLVVLMATTLVGGTWTLAQTASDIEANTKEIDVIKTVQTQAVVDVKRGISENADAIDKISRKFDLLLQELRIRNVVSETVAEPRE
jgi:hypothetical protein